MAIVIGLVILGFCALFYSCNRAFNAGYKRATGRDYRDEDV